MALVQKTSSEEVAHKAAKWQAARGLQTSPPHRRSAIPKGMDAETAYDLISSELLLDGSARLNLATFVTTSMPATGRPAHGRDRRQKHDRQGRVPPDRRDRAPAASTSSPISGTRRTAEQATGCSTTGSSEAVMLGGAGPEVALAGAPAGRRPEPTDRPNLVTGANVQVCWEKFCRYWDVEPRLVPRRRRPAPPDRRRGGQVLRREHHRRGGGARVDLRRQLRAGQGDRRRPRPAPARHRPRHPDPRGRGVRRLRRPVPPARPGMGLPDPAGAVDQRLRSQVRARLPRGRLGRLAQRRGPAGGADLRRQLPGRAHAHLLPQLLPSRQRGGRPVLHVHQPGLRGLPPGAAAHPRTSPSTWPRASPRSAPTA